VEDGSGGGREKICEEGEGSGAAENCGYYLRQRHGLVRRHEESLTLRADNTALWELRVDLRLPGEAEASWRDEHEKRLFLFPLVFLKKNEARMSLKVREEDGRAVHLPIRSECDSISSLAAAQAINSLGEPTLRFPEEALARQLSKIPAEKALQSTMALQEVRELFGILGGPHVVGERMRQLGARVVESGLDEVLEMLVEHSLVWVALRGHPNELRSIMLSEEVTVSRRALVRWSFGELKPPEHWWRHPVMAWRMQPNSKRAVLMIGSRRYGRREWRASPSAVGERIGQQLAWMPFDFEVPTIYTKRCDSYHFEVRCPSGRTPRDIKVSKGLPPTKKPGGREQTEPPRMKGTRKTLTAQVVRFDLPREVLDDVMRFRVTVGIADGAFPVIWFLAAAVTAAMLWIYAGAHVELTGPHATLRGDHAQTAAAILLIVPALVAGIAAGSNEVPISQLLGGARVLLLVAGLSAAIGASVLAGARPFDAKPGAAWAACAMVATATAAPLATSYLLCVPLTWRRLRALNSCEKQLAVLTGGAFIASVLAVILCLLAPAPVVRGAAAGVLLMLTVVLSAVANNRAAMDMGKTRHYIAASFVTAALICLGLACIELRAVVGHAGGLQYWAQRVAPVVLLVSLGIGRFGEWIASWANPRSDEVHVTPREARALIAEESVRELPTLFELERDARERSADKPKAAS
jgi:hypothetical protein